MSVWKYRGTVDEGGVPDRFILGVPTRDLTEEDFAALGETERRLVDEGDLYQRVGARKADGVAVAETVKEDSSHADE